MSQELIDRFYSAFSATDADAMAECYSNDVVFEDPAFGELHGDDARDMWSMMCGRAKDLAISYNILEVSGASARVNWIADYTFSTGRAVHNDIIATMKIEDGLIVDHRDVFDMWKWSRQAMGAPGLLLGWSPILQKKVRVKALEGLHAYQAAKD